MSSEYLLRFDDVCPTMNWVIWDKLAQCLNDLEIRPLIAVIPDNRDPSMHFHDAREDFWTQVRTWQQSGWAVALHGYQHLYTERQAGLWGTSPRSEFAGLSHSTQAAKIGKGVEIFTQNSVLADAWVAPNHSFDTSTIGALRENGIEVISDGMSLYPYRSSDGTFWVPCQLWNFRPRRLGVWTVCLHPNTWDQVRFDQFRSDLDRYRHQIVDLRSIIAKNSTRRQSVSDGIYSRYRRLRRHKK